jgi:hypothetical protein
MTKENARSTKQQQIIMYINGCDFIEVLGIWDAKASHPMLMTPLLEMALICSSSPVTLVSTNLTLEFLINYSSQRQWHSTRSDADNLALVLKFRVSLKDKKVQ